MKKIIQGWNIMRLLRLVLGIIILVQGINQKEYVFAFVGALFVVLSIANIGCCGSQACTTTPINKDFKNSKEITYEEVV
jgi:hypothetical protein